MAGWYSGAVSGRYSTFNSLKSALSLPQIEGARGADTERRSFGFVSACTPTMFNMYLLSICSKLKEVVLQQC